MEKKKAFVRSTLSNIFFFIMIFIMFYASEISTAIMELKKDPSKLSSEDFESSRTTSVSPFFETKDFSTITDSPLELNYKTEYITGFVKTCKFILFSKLFFKNF